MRRRPFRCDRHKTIWRSGALCRTAEAAYDPSIWESKLDSIEKQKASFNPEKRWRTYGKRRPLPLSISLKRLEWLGAEAGQHRNAEGVVLAPKSAGSPQEKGVLCLYPVDWSDSRG